LTTVRRRLLRGVRHWSGIARRRDRACLAAPYSAVPRAGDPHRGTLDFDRLSVRVAGSDGRRYKCGRSRTVRSRRLAYLVAWIPDPLLKQFRHRELQVVTAWWNRRLEPLLVSFLKVPRFHHGAKHFIDKRFEFRVVTTEHESVVDSVIAIGQECECG